jgi:hypothetical protein
MAHDPARSPVAALQTYCLRHEVPMAECRASRRATVAAVMRCIAQSTANAALWRRSVSMQQGQVSLRRHGVCCTLAVGALSACLCAGAGLVAGRAG